jgi:leucyl-tRNA synthetase
VASDITQEDALQIASDSEKIKRFIDDKEIIKTIFVPGRLINLVIK